MSESNARNPWKLATLAIAGAFALALVAGGVLRGLGGGEEPGAEPAAEVAPKPATQSAAAPPPPRTVEQCNRYAAEARRDPNRVLRDGVVGAAVGAGVGAAGGAIADGGSGAGKGAGIGALVGAAGGALYGLNEENRRSEAARVAYQRCMAERGY